jgi:predicted GIY-YIG superfamily endonuclease
LEFAGSPLGEAFQRLHASLRPLHFFGLVAQSVEQRPFKPLVRGSSPRQPTIFFCLIDTAWTHILQGAKGGRYIGSTTDLDRRPAEHDRGHTHSTKRLGGSLKLFASLQLPSLAEARALERELKRKKNPQLAI